MRLKILPIVIILLFSSVILSCLKDSCPEPLPYFEVVGLDGFAYRMQSQIPIGSSNPVEWNNIEYRIGLITSGVAETKITPSGNLYALDCPPDGYLGSKIGIESLVIRPLTMYTDFDMPDSFSSELFKVTVINEILSIREFNQIFREGYSFTSFKLLLNRPPKINGEIHQFEIELRLTDGKKFNFITGELRILG